MACARSTAISSTSTSAEAGEVFGFLGPTGRQTTAVKPLGSRADRGVARCCRLIGDRETRRRVGYLPELFRYQAWPTATRS
jgi:ABC-2 type transport system ATP-binding protein